jgi:hypothetical protein
MIFLQVENTRNNEFKKSIDAIATDTISLTREYQAEEGKWTDKQYDNATMIIKIDAYSPRYQDLIDRANAVATPAKYAVAKGFLIKSIESEKQSNEHFRNHLQTGDPQEYERSVDLFSLSLRYSAEYDAAIGAAG